MHSANSYRRTPIEKGGLLPEHIASLRELKKKENWVIIRPDKGSGVVLLDRANYTSKMQDILSDSNKFGREFGLEWPSSSPSLPDVCRTPWI